MAMSMSSLQRPLEADPVILLSFLRSVPVIKGSRWTWTPSNVARAVPIARLACSCLATVQGGLLMHIYLVVSKSIGLHTVPTMPRGRRQQRARVCRAAETSRSVSLKAGEKGMTDSDFLPSREDPSMTDLALCGSTDSRRKSLAARNASWHRSRCERTVWLALSISWSSKDDRRVSEASEAAANERGAHVWKDRMPRPLSLTGRVIMAFSTARDLPGTLRRGSCSRNWPGTRPVVPRGVLSRLSAGNAAGVTGSAVDTVGG
jgi:hypothetical protein